MTTRILELHKNSQNVLLQNIYSLKTYYSHLNHLKPYSGHILRDTIPQNVDVEQGGEQPLSQTSENARLHGGMHGGNNSSSNDNSNGGLEESQSQGSGNKECAKFNPVSVGPEIEILSDARLLKSHKPMQLPSYSKEEDAESSISLQGPTGGEEEPRQSTTTTEISAGETIIKNEPLSPEADNSNITEQTEKASPVKSFLKQAASQLGTWDTLGSSSKGATSGKRVTRGEAAKKGLVIQEVPLPTKDPVYKKHKKPK